MNKKMLEIVNDLSKKPTTELALQIMELSSENLILEQQVKKQKEVIDKAIKYIEKFIPIDEDTILMRERQRDYLLDILNEVT